MEILENIFRITLIFHLLAFAVIFNGVFSQVKNFKIGAQVKSGILHASWLALITGLILTGLAYTIDSHGPNSLVLALKGAGITLIFLLAYSFSRKPIPPKWVVPTIGVITVLNVCFAAMGR